METGVHQERPVFFGMKIFYSTLWFETHFRGSSVSKNTGWGRFVHLTHKALLDAGVEVMSDEPESADFELFLGQPFFYLHPQLSPNAIFSMWEATTIYHHWVRSFNCWDKCYVPSDWNRQVFFDCGVKTPIEKLTLPVDLTQFPYVERDPNLNTWNYIVQGVSLNDRKMIPEVADLFLRDRMPSDTRLLIKLAPNQKDLPVIDAQIHPQVRLIQAVLPLDEYYRRCFQDVHVSVNPSAGEGFGYLAAEPMATGMCCIVSDFSAHTEFTRIRPKICLPIWTDEVLPQLVFKDGVYFEGKVGAIDAEDCYQKMIWTYEHREEALKIGKRASEWIRRVCSPERFASDLLTRISNQIAASKRRAYAVDEEKLIDWDMMRQLYNLDREEFLSRRVRGGSQGRI